MEKKVLAAADCAAQKYFLEPAFAALPEQILEEVKTICIVLAQKLNCTFLIGFYENGEVYFETVQREDDFDFDQIGAELEIKRLQRQEAELFRALQMWYTVFFTKDGKQMREELLKNAEKTDAGETL